MLGAVLCYAMLLTRCAVLFHSSPAQRGKTSLTAVNHPGLFREEEMVLREKKENCGHSEKKRDKDGAEEGRV